MDKNDISVPVDYADVMEMNIRIYRAKVPELVLRNRQFR